MDSMFGLVRQGRNPTHQWYSSHQLCIAPKRWLPWHCANLQLGCLRQPVNSSVVIDGCSWRVSADPLCIIRVIQCNGTWKIEEWKKNEWGGTTEQHLMGHALDFYKTKQNRYHRVCVLFSLFFFGSFYLFVDIDTRGTKSQQPRAHNRIRISQQQ